MFVHLSRELARAERLKSEVALIVMDIDGFKTDQRHLRPQRRRPRAARGGGRAAGRAAAVRPLRALRRRRVHRRARRTARARRRRPSGASCRTRSPRSSSRCAPASGCAWPPAPAPSVFPHDGATYEALLADADQRMYRDKAARRGHLNVRTPAPRPELQDADLFDQDGSDHPTRRCRRRSPRIPSSARSGN